MEWSAVAAAVVGLLVALQGLVERKTRREQMQLLRDERANQQFANGTRAAIERMARQVDRLSSEFEVYVSLDEERHRRLQEGVDELLRTVRRGRA